MDEAVYALYSSPNIFFWMTEPRRMRWLGQVVPSGERGAYRDLAEKSEGKRPVARPRRIWECNCQIKTEETGWVSMD